MPSKSNTAVGNLRDKLEDENLDLSLMQLDDVPVKEIACLPKGTTLDLSNNLLRFLPENFPTLTHLIKLDLSKNQLAELPEYFGQLKNLRHLDLYSNQLSMLPVSFCQLKNLKWLDLKNNPLLPTLLQAAGPCITGPDCAMCAKKVVALMQSRQSQLERERQKKALEEQKAAQEQRAQEEAERERIRAEKKAAKERRREEARAKEEAKKREMEALMANMQHEMEQPRNGNSHGVKSDKDGGRDSRPTSGWCWSLVWLLAGLLVVALGLNISVLWIYTDGHLDQRSIERAMPVLQRDLESAFARASKQADQWLDHTRPYTKQASQTAAWIWADLQERNKLVAHYINKQWGPSFCTFKTYLADQAKWAQAELARAWVASKPYFHKLGDLAIHYAGLAWNWAQTHIPVYLDYAYDRLLHVVNLVQTQVNNLMASPS